MIEKPKRQMHPKVVAQSLAVKTVAAHFRSKDVKIPSLRDPNYKDTEYYKMVRAVATDLIAGKTVDEVKRDLT